RALWRGDPPPAPPPLASRILSWAPPGGAEEGGRVGEEERAVCGVVVSLVAAAEDRENGAALLLKAGVWRALLSRAVARLESNDGEEDNRRARVREHGAANGPVLAALVVAAALCEKTDAFLRRAPPLKEEEARMLLPERLWVCWELSAPIHANPGGEKEAAKARAAQGVAALERLIEHLLASLAPFCTPPAPPTPPTDAAVDATDGTVDATAVATNAAGPSAPAAGTSEAGGAAVEIMSFLGAVVAAAGGGGRGGGARRTALMGGAAGLEEMLEKAQGRVLGMLSAAQKRFLVLEQDNEEAKAEREKSGAEEREKDGEEDRGELLTLGEGRLELLQVRKAKEQLGEVARLLKHLLADPTARKDD
ncbi:hypothetical protein T484DRAFT_1777576, partial [Baffinella frigidus]